MLISRVVTVSLSIFVDKTTRDCRVDSQATRPQYLLRARAPMKDQKGVIPRLSGPQDNFLYGSRQMKEILKAKQVCHVVPIDDAANSISFHVLRRSNAGSDVGSNPEYARDVACSILLQGLGVVSIWFTRYQEDPRQKWKLLYELYSATTTFTKAIAHTTLGRMKYICQPMHEYVAKWETCAAQLASTSVPMDGGLPVTIFC